MPAQVHQIASRALLVIVVASLVLVQSRPNHFGDANQAVAEQDAANNLLDSGVKPWQQLEFLAQRLNELREGGGDLGGWERGLRSPESKRQSRYRQCYFNPISCFRK